MTFTSKNYENFFFTRFNKQSSHGGIESFTHDLCLGLSKKKDSLYSPFVLDETDTSHKSK